MRREITKKQYETKNLDGVFKESELCGYGVYGVSLIEDKEENKYYVDFTLGSSCD